MQASDLISLLWEDAVVRLEHQKSVLPHELTDALADALEQRYEAKIIRLRNRGYSLIDESDYGPVGELKWFQTVRGYTMSTKTFKQPPKRLSIHRLVLPTKPGFEVDHINRNPLDNRRSNLRQCTHAQNLTNIVKPRKRMAYRGVYKRSKGARYEVLFKVNGKPKCFGHYDTELEAAKAYNVFIKQYQGEFAILNPV